jgi:hypothetical protein
MDSEDGRDGEEHIQPSKQLFRKFLHKLSMLLEDQIQTQNIDNKIMEKGLKIFSSYLKNCNRDGVVSKKTKDVVELGEINSQKKKYLLEIGIVKLLGKILLQAEQIDNYVLKLTLKVSNQLLQKGDVNS